MTNGEEIIAILKPRKDQIRIYGNWVEIEIQRLGINFSCGLEWWNAEYIEPNYSENPKGSTTKNDLGVDVIPKGKAIAWAEFFTDIYDAKTANESIMGMLRELPSVTPKGHWIKQNDDYYDWYECSECGYGSDGEMQYSSEYDVRTNYCPNCGSYNGGASNGNE